jgi:hypothetical protein
MLWNVSPFDMFSMLEVHLSRIRENLSPSQGKTMHAVVEAQSIIFRVPRRPLEKMGDYIRRAGSMFKLTPSQAKKIVYGEVKDLRASRLDYMRARIEELQQRAVKRGELLDDLEARTADLRSRDGVGNPQGSSRGAAPLGRRGDGEMARGSRESGGNAAARRDQE